MKLQTAPKCGCGRRLKPYGNGQYWCPGFHPAVNMGYAVPPLEAFVPVHEWVQSDGFVTQNRVHGKRDISTADKE